MKIAEDDRAFLISSMSDASVAAMLSKTVAWVQVRRAMIAQEAASNPAPEINTPPEAPAQIDIEEAIAAAEPVDVAADGSLVPDMIGVAAGPPPAVDPADLIGAPEPELIPVLIDAPAHRKWNAPEDLCGAALADWIYDNTTASAEEIAAATGLTLAQVRAVMDGEDPVAAPTPEKTAVQAPRAVSAPTVRKAPARPSAPRPAPASAPRAEIPARVLRWAGFFIAARWQLASVAHLFDVEAADLGAALDRRQRAA